MIFMMYDKYSTVEGSKHNYIILGTNDNNERLGVLQCMAITSMRSKEIGTEVPILLSNDMVSYIVPYNIHSFDKNEIELKNFKGCITDTDQITKYEFMQLLVDLYADNLDLGLTDKEDVMSRYNAYCENFWKEHKDCVEFREVEQAEIDKRKANIQEQEIQNTQPVEKPKSKRKRRSGKKVKQSRKMNNRSRESAKRKQEKIERRELNESIKEYIGVSSTSLNTVDDTQVAENIENTYVLPVLPETFIDSKIELSELSILNNSPRNSKDFSSKELILFLQGYEQFNYDELKSVIPDRWNSPNSFKNFFLSAQKEAILRHIYVHMQKGLIGGNKLNISCSDWTSDDLISYLNVTNNHKDDPDFLLEYTGLDNITKVNQKTFQVKKEAQNRKIAV